MVMESIYAIEKNTILAVNTDRTLPLTVSVLDLELNEFHTKSFYQVLWLSGVFPYLPYLVLHPCGGGGTIFCDHKLSGV